MRSQRNSDASLNREIDFHLAALIDANIARGMTPEQARRQARIDFGGRTQIVQRAREVHLWKAVETLRTSVRAALRFIRRAPGFSLTIVLTLALGIGANSAVFSAVDAILLRPLPFPRGDDLLLLRQSDAQGRNANHFVAPVRLEDWNRMASDFTGITGYYKDDLSETSGSLPERVTEALVAPRFLNVLQIAPMLGRNFTREEEHWAGPDAVLISYGFWQRRFHGDAAVLGKQLKIGRFHYSIVGVMPRTFAVPDKDVDLWAPSPPDAPYAQLRDETWYTVIGRKKSDVSLAQAQANLETVQAQLAKQFPKPDGELRVSVTPLKQTIIGNTGQSLWLLYGSVSLLLLIACSNIAALLIARTADREQEIAIRFSLGASRRAIIGQLLAEVLGLTLIGCTAGLLVAFGAAHGFHLLANRLPRAEEVALNWRIVAYTLACAIATTLLCGLYPALRGTRRELAQGLSAGSRTQVSARQGMLWAIVGVQVTLSVTLLVGAGLLIRSMDQIGRVSPGFDPSHILTFQVSGSWSETTDKAAMKQRIDRTLNGLRNLPGIEAAATSQSLPGVSSKYQMELKIEDKMDPSRRIMADLRYVSPGYLATMRIPLLTGQDCRDTPEASTEVLVNRSFANLYLGGTGAVGREIEDATSNVATLKGLIRGIVGDAREQGLNEPPIPTVYVCYSAPNPFPNYLVRASGEPLALADALRRRMRELEPSRSVFAVTPLSDHLAASFAEETLRTRLLTLFALTAVSLASIGLYGTLTYVIRLRQREVGIRLALGALRSHIVIMFLKQGLWTAACGAAGGLVLAVMLSRNLRGMLYGISALDPSTYAAVLALVLLVTAAASLIPSMRAARLQPVRILRED